MLAKSFDDLESLVEASFLAEINALKPGNVHKYAAGHDMTVADFELSARITTPILCDKSLSVGERIYTAVCETMEQVGCNTNLGMILLYAPLIVCVQNFQDSVNTKEDLRHHLGQLLAGLDQTDADWVFKAISLANPGGLGSTEQYDVKKSPVTSIYNAMYAAKDRDRIALQYVSDFEDIFQSGVVWIRQAIERWNRVDWAVVLCYLNFFSRYSDSHIARKFGEAHAEKIRKNTEGLALRFGEQTSPYHMQEELLQYDSELKATGINPGTTADLTAASILVYYLVDNNF